MIAKLADFFCLYFACSLFLFCSSADQTIKLQKRCCSFVLYTTMRGVERCTEDSQSLLLSFLITGRRTNLLTTTARSKTTIENLAIAKPADVRAALRAHTRISLMTFKLSENWRDSCYFLQIGAAARRAGAYFEQSVDESL